MLWKKVMQILCAFKILYNVGEYYTDVFHLLKSVPLSTTYLLKCLQLLVFYDLAFITESSFPLSSTNPSLFNIHIHPSDM